MKLSFKALLATCLSVLPLGAAGHLPALFGKEYVRSDLPVAVDEQPWSYSAVPELAPADPDPFDYEVMEQERSAGPYADGLAEPLSSLGFYYARQGNYPEAINAYRRALHLTRINEGLTSERQLPILRNLLEIYRTVGDYASLDRSYEYFFRLHGIGTPPYTRERFKASMEYLQWQREAYTSGQDGRARSRLLQAYLVNKRMLDSHATEADPDSDEHYQLVMSQIHNLYLLLGDDPVYEQAEGLASRDKHAGLGGSEPYVRHAIDRVQLTGDAQGRKLLLGLIERSPGLPVQEQAALHLELGDWYQWNSSLSLASKEYARVVSLLAGAGESALAEKWLGQPMELPDETGLWQKPRFRKSRPLLEVETSYDVSARGNVTNIEIMGSEQADNPQAWRIKRMLRDTHFRPRFSQGYAESSSQVTRRYRLLH